MHFFIIYSVQFACLRAIELSAMRTMVDGLDVIEYAANDELNLLYVLLRKGGEVSGAIGHWAMLPYCLGCG